MRTRLGLRRISAKYAAIAAQAARNRLAYPKDLLGRTFFLAFILFVYGQLWGKVLGARGDLAGFGRNQLIWYMAFTEAVGLAFPRLQGTVNDDVRTGGIAYRLNRPLSYLGQLLAEYLGETAVNVLATMAVGTLTALALAGGLAGFTPAHGLLTLVIVVLGVLLSFFISAALALSAFWLEDNGPLFWVYSKINFILGGLFIPVEVYPGFFRALAEFLPFRLVFAAAARLAVRFDPVLFRRAAAAQLGWLLAAAGAAILVYRRGVRKLNVNGG